MVLEIEPTAFLPVFLGHLGQQWRKHRGSGEAPMRLPQTQVETLLRYIEAESVRFHKTVERGNDKLRRFIGNWVEGLDDETSLEAKLIDIEKNWGLPQSLIELHLWKANMSFNRKKYKEALQIWKSQLR